MKRLVVLLASVLFVLTASPAQAIHFGTVCKLFNGPDGGGGVEARVCVYINKNDWNGDLQAIGRGNNSSGHRFVWHGSYVRLVRNGENVRDSGSWVYVMDPGETDYRLTNWFDNPSSGTWWARIRTWVCFPTLPNDPCSPVTIWNSQEHGE